MTEDQDNALTVEDSERVLEALKAGAGPVTHSRFEVWGAYSVKVEGREITFVAALFRGKSRFWHYAQVHSLFLGDICERALPQVLHGRRAHFVCGIFQWAPRSSSRCPR